MSSLGCSYVIMLYVVSEHIQEVVGFFNQYENATFNGEQEKECITHVRMGWKNLSLAISICHHSASLVMPNSDPRDGISYPSYS